MDPPPPDTTGDSDSADSGAIAGTFVPGVPALPAGGAESRAPHCACHTSTDHRHSAKQCPPVGNATAY